MRFLTASIVFGPLMLIGALPAVGQPTPPPGSGLSIRVAAGGDATADKDTYTQMARDEMQEWQRKLRDFGDKAEAQGKEAGTAAENDLNKAWTKAEAASRHLQAAGAAGWENAKSSFEQASRELAKTWHKFHPEDK